MAKRIRPSEPALTRRQTSRAKREAQIQRWVVISTVVIAVAVVGLVIFAIVNQQVILPSRAIATVNGENITVKQFQDRVRVDIYFTSQNQFAQNTDPRVIAQQSLDTLVEEALIRQKAKELIITVSEEDVNRRAGLLFGYDGGTPEPTSTPLPTREPTKLTTATPTSTFVFTPTSTQTPTPDPALAGTPTATSTDEPTATPTIDLTTTATPTPTPTKTLIPTATQTNTPRPTATPLSAEAYSTQLYEILSGGATLVGLSSEKIHEVWLDQIRAAILREKVLESLDIQPDETRESVHAAHILVSSEEEARVILERLKAGENFETVAAQFSIDSSNAYKGGDLGWFGKDDMVEPFATIAFETAQGTLSDVVQTNFGWHIIKVYEKASVPLSANEQNTSIQLKFSDMVTQWEEEGEVTKEPDWAQYMPELPGS